MSDTENKTEDKVEKIDTAPYMKKADTDSKTVSTKSNFVIPLVLLLVSAMVIVATFYEDEYNALLAQSEEASDNTQLEAQTSTSPANIETAAIEVEEATAISKASTPTEDAITATTTTEAATVTAEVAPVTQNINAQAVSALATTAQAKTAQLQPGTQFRPGNTNRYNGYNREQAKAQTQQHMAMLEQRRQAYEQEMQARRTQYEAAMKAQQERRNNMMAAQKAAYQQAHKNKVETGEKLQIIYKKIDELHREIDQIMRQYYSTQRSTGSAPMHTM